MTLAPRRLSRQEHGAAYWHPFFFDHDAHAAVFAEWTRSGDGCEMAHAFHCPGFYVERKGEGAGGGTRLLPPFWAGVLFMEGVMQGKEWPLPRRRAPSSRPSLGLLQSASDVHIAAMWIGTAGQIVGA